MTNNNGFFTSYYILWDDKANQRVDHKRYTTRARARRAADRLNLEYGAHRYSVEGCCE